MNKLWQILIKVIINNQWNLYKKIRRLILRTRVEVRRILLKPNGWFAKWDIAQKRVYYLYLIYIAFGCNIWYTIPNKMKVVKVCQ